MLLGFVVTEDFMVMRRTFCTDSKVFIREYVYVSLFVTLLLFWVRDPLWLRFYGKNRSI